MTRRSKNIIRYFFLYKKNLQSYNREYLDEMTEIYISHILEFEVEIINEPFHKFLKKRFLEEKEEPEDEYVFDIVIKSKFGISKEDDEEYYNYLMNELKKDPYYSTELKKLFAKHKKDGTMPQLKRKLKRGNL